METGSEWDFSTKRHRGMLIELRAESRLAGQKPTNNSSKSGSGNGRMKVQQRIDFNQLNAL